MLTLLTTQEAADRLRCHEKTVRRMILRGDLQASFVAGRYLISEDDLPLGPATRKPPPAKPRKAGGRFAQIAQEMDAA